MQTTPYPEANLSKFGKGRDSVQSQLDDFDKSLSLKRDRDYIRRIIQESKEK